MTEPTSQQPFDLNDDQLDLVQGGTIRNPDQTYGDGTRNALEDEMWGLVQANRGKPDDTILLAANSPQAQALTARLWNQPDLIFDINEVAKNGYTKGELASLVHGMDAVDEVVNQRGGTHARERDGLESDMWTLINNNRNKPADSVLIAAGSPEMATWTERLSKHVDSTYNLAQFQQNGLTAAEFQKMAQEMEMTDTLLNRRGIRTGQ